MQGTTPSSATLTAQPALSVPTTMAPGEGRNAEGCGSAEVSSKEDDSVDSSSEEAAEA